MIILLPTRHTKIKVSVSRTSHSSSTVRTIDKDGLKLDVKLRKKSQYNPDDRPVDESTKKK